MAKTAGVLVLLLIVAISAVTTMHVRAQEVVVSGEDSFILEPLSISLNNLVPDTTYTLRFNVSGFILLASSGGVEIVNAPLFGNAFAFKPLSSSVELVFLPFTTGKVSARLFEGPFTRGLDILDIKPVEIDPLIFPEAIANESVDLEVVLASMAGLGESRPGGYTIHYRIKDFGDGYLTVYITAGQRLRLDSLFVGNLLGSLGDLYDVARLVFKGALGGEPGRVTPLEISLLSDVEGSITGLSLFEVKLLDLELRVSGPGSLSLLNINSTLALTADNVDFYVESNALRIYTGGSPLNVTIKDSKGLLSLTVSGRAWFNVESRDLLLSLRLTGSTQVNVDELILESLSLAVDGDSVLNGGLIDSESFIDVRVKAGSSLEMAGSGGVINANRVTVSGEGSYTLTGYTIRSPILDLNAGSVSLEGLSINSSMTVMGPPSLAILDTSISGRTVNITSQNLRVDRFHLDSTLLYVRVDGVGNISRSAINADSLILAGPGALLASSSTIETGTIELADVEATINASSINVGSITGYSTMLRLEASVIESPSLVITGEELGLELNRVIVVSSELNLAGDIATSGSLTLAGDDLALNIDGVSGDLNIYMSPEIVRVSASGSLNLSLSIDCMPTIIHVNSLSLESFRLNSTGGLCAVYTMSPIYTRLFEILSGGNVLFEGAAPQSVVQSSLVLFSAKELTLSGVRLDASSITIVAGNLTSDNVGLEADETTVDVEDAIIKDSYFNATLHTYNVEGKSTIAASRINGYIIDVNLRGTMVFRESTLTANTLAITGPGTLIVSLSKITIGKLALDEGVLVDASLSRLVLGDAFLDGNSSLTLAYPTIKALAGTLNIVGGEGALSITAVNIDESNITRMVVTGGIRVDIETRVPPGFSLEALNSTGRMHLKTIGDLHLVVTGRLNISIETLVDGSTIDVGSDGGNANLSIIIPDGRASHVEFNNAYMDRLSLKLGTGSKATLRGVLHASIIESRISGNSILEADVLEAACTALHILGASSSTVIVNESFIECTGADIYAGSVLVADSAFNMRNVNIAYRTALLRGLSLNASSASFNGSLDSATLIEDAVLAVESLRFSGDSHLYMVRGSSMGSGRGTLLIEGDVGLLIDGSLVRASAINGVDGGAVVVLYNGSGIRAGGTLLIAGLNIIALGSEVTASSLDLVEANLVIKYSSLNADVNVIDGSLIEAFNNVDLKLDARSVSKGLLDLRINGVEARVDYSITRGMPFIVGYMALGDVALLGVNPPVNNGVLVDLTITALGSMVTGIELTLDLEALDMCEGDHVEVYRLDYATGDWHRIAVPSIIDGCMASISISPVREPLYTATLLLNPVAIEPETVTVTETMVEERTVTHTTTTTITERVVEEKTITVTRTTTIEQARQTITVTTTVQVAQGAETETVYETVTVTPEAPEKAGISPTLLALAVIAGFILGIVAMLLARRAPGRH